MATSFPTSLQDLDATRGTASDPLSTPSHVTHHTTEDDTVEALQAKVGIDSSAVVTSHDYLIGTKAPIDSPVFTTAVTLPVALTGLIRADSGVVSVDTDVTDLVTTATDSAEGKVELATDAETITGTATDRVVTPANLEAKVSSVTESGISELATTAEIDTGTDSTRTMPVDQFVASSRNVRNIDWRVLESSTAQSVASFGGDFEFPFTGTIVSIGAYVDTAGTTGTATYDVNIGGTTIMTTNKISVETGEKSSRDATTQPALTTTAVTVGDIFTVDIDAIQTTPANGLTVRFGVRLT